MSHKMTNIFALHGVSGLQSRSIAVVCLGRSVERQIVNEANMLLIACFA